MHRRDSSMTTTVVRTRTASTVTELRCSVVTAAYTSTVARAPYLYASLCVRKYASL
jgi:hypothetical protein